jgi:diaminopimelate epimerase
LSGRIPQGVNVEIATMVGPGHIDLSVWERGVGRTLACGTGAAATAVAAVSLGHAPANVPLAIHLPGGPLQLTVTETLDVTLRGPARFVFRGSVPR